jgi:hypothetical protein
MVEATTTTATTDTTTLIQKYLGTFSVIIDPKFKDTLNMKETQAHRRKELI